MAHHDFRLIHAGRAAWPVVVVVVLVGVLVGCDSSGPSATAGSETNAEATPVNSAQAPSATAGTSTCTKLSDSTAIRSLGKPLAALASGSGTRTDRRKVAAAVADLHDAAADAPAPLADKLLTTVRVINALETHRPNRSSLNKLTGAFTHLDKEVRVTCHFPLR